MGEFFLVVGLVLLTALVFVVWLCVQIAGAIVRIVFGSKRNSAPARAAMNGINCRNPRCQATNPHHARFCSRCGSPAGVPMRYVA